jgi:hypothetical protein
LRSVALLALLAAVARADEPVHVTAQAGGTLRLDAPSVGFWAAAELWPAGLWGLRADLYRLDGPFLVEGAVSRALGATWRHLVIAAHAGAGVEVEHGDFAVAAGLNTQIGLGVGPLVVATDLALHVVFGDGRSEALVTATLGLGATF